jgi:hypothetical protein
MGRIPPWRARVLAIAAVNLRIISLVESYIRADRTFSQIISVIFKAMLYVHIEMYSKSFITKYNCKNNLTAHRMQHKRNKTQNRPIGE